MTTTIAPANFIIIPLDHLALSPKNVRKTDADSVDDLLASIPVHGLIQSLAVEAGAKKGKFLVIAGGRRLKALQILAKEKIIAKDFPVPCRLVTSEAEALSIAENVIRAPMHSADQFEAFAALITAGKSVEEVANAYGVSETIVKKRMKLAAVAPEIIAAYRADELKFEQVAAYAVEDSHDRQRAVFAANPDAHSSLIRRMLTEGEVTLADKRVKFVGIDAYVEAGGAVRRDLFAENDAGVYLTDIGLLDQLFNAKLAGLIAEIKAEGWREVSYHDGNYWELQQTFKGRIYPTRVPITKDRQAERDLLEERLELVSNQLEEDDQNTDLLAAFDQLDKELAAYDPAEIYADEDKARAVALIMIDRDGNVQIERGLTEAAKGKGAAGSPIVAVKLDIDGLPQVGNSLTVELAAVRCAVISADLATNSQKALAVTVYTMAIKLLLSYSSYDGPTSLSLSNGRFAESISRGDMRPLAALATALEGARKALPEHPKDWLAHLLALDVGALLDLLAVFTAHSINPFGQYAPTFAKAAADDLATSMDTQAARWVTLSDLDYLARVPKKQILAVVEKLYSRDKAEILSTMKKGDLVAKATELLDGKWLPSQLSELVSREDRDSARANHSEVLRGDAGDIEDDADEDFDSDDDETDVEDTDADQE
jgi:ParB family chromosome partitioning protein